MPLLPSAADYGPPPAPDVPLPVVTDQSGQTLAGAVEGAAKQTSATLLGDIQAQNRFDLATGRQKIVTASASARMALQDDPDWATHLPRYQQAMADAVKQVAGSANPRIRGMLQAYGADQTARGALDVNANALRAKRDQSQAELLSNVDDTIKSASQDPNAGNRMAAIQNISDMIDAKVQSGDIKAVEGQRLKQAATQKYSEGIIRMLPPDQQLEALKNPGGTPAEFIDPDRRALMIPQAQAGASKSIADGIVGTYRDQGPTAGGKALAAVDGMNIPDDMKDQVRAHVHAGLAQRMAEAQQTNSQQVIATEEAIGSGRATEDTRNSVWDLYRKGAFTPQEVAAKLAAIDRQQMAGAGNDANMEFAQQHFALGIPLDPQSKDNKDGVDSFFKGSYGTAFQAGSPGWTNGAAQIAERTGVVPDTVVSWTRAQLVSGDPKTAAVAADSVARLIEASPRGAPFAIDDKTKVLSAEINRMVQAGTDPVTAVEIARKNATLPEPERKLLDEKYRKSIPGGGVPGGYMDAKLLSLLADDKDFKAGMFAGVPDRPPEMVAAFSNLTHDYYLMNGGNAQAAQQLAASDVKAIWGVSTVNGTREIMKYPPEKVSGTPVDVIRSDIASTLKDAGIDVDPAKARLVSIPETERTQGVKWGIGVPGQAGSYDVVMDANGNVRPYSLPGPAAQAAALAEHKEKRLADARASLDRQHAADATMGKILASDSAVWH